MVRIIIELDNKFMGLPEEFYHPYNNTNRETPYFYLNTKITCFENHKYLLYIMIKVYHTLSNIWVVTLEGFFRWGFR